MNGYKKQLAQSHGQLGRNKRGERVPIARQGAKDSNSNTEKWVARLTVMNEAYIRSNQSQQNTHIYPEPVYYFIFTFQYFVT